MREDVGEGQCQGEVHSNGQCNLDNDECQIHVSDSIAIHLQREWQHVRQRVTKLKLGSTHTRKGTYSIQILLQW